MDTASSTIYEADLARELRVDRDVIKRLRVELLIEGPDWCNAPGRGIALSNEASQKIRAAVGVPAPAVAVTFDLMVRCLVPNPRICICVLDGRNVKCLPTNHGGRGATTLRPGLILKGCLKANAELYTYDGPLPLRRGLPIPEKKEAAV
jgi:hypothetical protein